MKPIIFDFSGVYITVPSLFRKQVESLDFPPNFGKVNKFLYRGSWPNQLQLRKMQSQLGIKHLVSLHSSYGDEPERLSNLKNNLPLGMFHHEIEVLNPSSFIKAAKKVIAFEEPAYVHCSAGSNRTGKTILIAQILSSGSSGAVTQSQLQTFLSQMLAFGFDYDKSYKQILEEVLEILLSQGKISAL